MTFASADDTDVSYINVVLFEKMKYNLRSITRFSFFVEIKTMLKAVLAVIKRDKDTDDNIVVVK